ncbi:PilC/PilY family type IV pilus protein [Colwellia sp. 1_MG-2023]|uniref:pilus assembly protein n=1 Tax=Colwellia sp. 1_MG-2023 TaxID=3062649 RepID=UPI0026E2BA9E|nr:PilC/PilY family type IV pilus protein [Colwellia sp. 1_MG-2023]MDO6445835.1 PilC/PilY family type IV pilus protein [Colwellia sp. 1_MG-2023]
MKKVLTLILTCALTVSFFSIGEDIELYISDTVKQLAQRPQVLIIFDNSGSMGTKENVNASYDPDTEYDAVGGLNSLSDKFIYFVKGGADGAALPTPDSPSEVRRFLDEINSCQTARDILATTGFYTGHIREYSLKGNAGTWEELPDNNGANIEVIDCEDDVTNEDPTNVAGLDSGYPIDNEGNKKNPVYHTANVNDSNVNWSGTLVTLYTDNYLRWHHGEDIAQVSRSRLDQAKESITNVIKSAPSVDFGLQIFNYDDGDKSTDPNGGRIVFGIDELDDTKQAAFLKIVNDELKAQTWTPLCESLYESYNYFAGKSVDFGDDDQSQGKSYTKNKPPRDTSIESSSKYITPFSNCNGKAYVILITDGEPTYDNGADKKIEALTSEEDGSTVKFNGTKYKSNYLAGLAGWMNDYDVNTDLDGSQKVSTFTIGFSKGADSAEELLKETASRGGGQYFKAKDSVQLTAALLTALGELEPSNDSLTSASVASNNFDRTETLNAVYYAMFNPQNGPRWQGNLKKYKVIGGKQVGQSKVPALNEDTGHFSDSVTSFWSPTNSKDGDKVAEGGVADMLRKTNSRTLYSDLTVDGDSLVTFNRTNAEKAFTDAAGLAAELDVLEDDIDDTLNWHAGIDVDDEDGDNSTTDMRYDVFGDPLHSKPLVVNYGDSIRIMIGTNAGVLHMFEDNTETDVVSETWAFLPKEFLSNIKHLRNNYSSADKVYGIDGRITSYIKDVNGDGVVNGTDKVYIFFGLRRGGSSYYALDITSPTSPKLLWKIDSDTSGFSELGQSWSQPKIGYSALNVTGTTAEPVLIFGGGYDAGKDAAGVGGDDSSGRAIYMVDAKTGTLKWSLAPSGGTMAFSGITDSIASSIGMLDSDGNGLVDRLYAGDTGGNIWRVDMPDKSPTDPTNPWTVFKLASLGGTTNDTDRRFFNEPSIVRTFITETIETTVTDEEGATTKITSKQEKPYEAILIGSGDRSNPLGEDTQDSFFMIKDENIKTQSFPSKTLPTIPAPTAITMSQLYDYTNDPFGQTLTTTQLNALELAVSKKQGWYINFGKSDGEKNTESAIVIKGVAYFTSFMPPSLVANQAICEIPGGQGWLYAVDLAQGTSKYNWVDSDNPDGITDGDERKVYISEQFLGTPTLIVVPEDDGDDETIDEAVGNIIVGRKIVPVGFNLQTMRTHLYIDENN